MKLRMILFAAVFFMAQRAPAYGITAEEAEQKAESINKLVESDVIYSQEANKALYYQNIEMISLLKEIRDLLKENLEKTAKNPAA